MAAHLGEGLDGCVALLIVLQLCQQLLCAEGGRLQRGLVARNLVVTACRQRGPLLPATACWCDAWRLDGGGQRLRLLTTVWLAIPVAFFICRYPSWIGQRICAHSASFDKLLEGAAHQMHKGSMSRPRAPHTFYGVQCCARSRRRPPQQRLPAVFPEIGLNEVGVTAGGSRLPGGAHGHVAAGTRNVLEFVWPLQPLAQPTSNLQRRAQVFR